MDKFPLGAPVNRGTGESKWYVKRGLDKPKPGFSKDSLGRLSFDPFKSLTPPAEKEKTKKWRHLSDFPKKEGMYVVRQPHRTERYVRTFDGCYWLSIDGGYLTGKILDGFEWCEHE